jgi:hypothetical protein
MDELLTNDHSPDREPTDPFRPMNFEELCRYLKARPQTIRAYLAEGLGRVGFKVGKEWRFLPLDVIEWLKWRHRRKTGEKPGPAMPPPSRQQSAPQHIERFLNKHWPQ